ARAGRKVPIDDSGAPIRDDRGAIAGAVVVFRDVTERQQADEAEVFRQVNERMELAVRGSNVGVWELEVADGEPLPTRRHDPNGWEQLGWECPPAGGEGALTEVAPEDRARVVEAMRKYLAGETTEFESEVRIRHKDGSYGTMLARGVAVRDAPG